MSHEPMFNNSIGGCNNTRELSFRDEETKKMEETIEEDEIA